jgi:DNA-binding XRE family transcriptional regulator
MPLVVSLIGASGIVEMDRVADSFGMSKLQLAETIGLGSQAIYKTDRARAARTQSRVKEMLEIVSRISDWAGGKERAMAWYRAQPIAAFGGRTAESLVKSGQAGALRDYLDHIAMGGFA